MKIKVNKLAIEMLFFKTTVLFEINVETVFLALLFSHCSSMILNCKLGNFWEPVIFLMLWVQQLGLKGFLFY